MVWILIAVQLIEVLWVVLNFLGIEKTVTETTVRYVGDIHLSYMPFSHSLFLPWFLVLLWVVCSISGKGPGASLFG